MSRIAVTRLQAVVALAVIIFAAAAGYAYYVSIGQPGGQAPAEILIGAVLPLTGGNSFEGSLFKSGYELATRQVNDAGGIFVKDFNKKIPVKLIIFDDESKEANTIRLLEQLVTFNKVDALLGGYSSPLVLAQVAVPANYKVPYINGGGGSTPIYLSPNGTRRSEWVFGLLAVIRELSRNTLDLLKVKVDQGLLPKPLRIAMVWMTGAHGKDYELGVLDKVKEFPGYFDLVLDESFQANAKDFTPLLLKVKAANAAVFLCDCFLPDYLTMHRQYIELGLLGSHKVVSYGARGPESEARQQFKDKSDYLISALWWTNALQFSQVKTFLDSWNTVSKTPPDWYGALGYQTAVTLYKAIENAGSLDKVKIKQALQSVKVSSAIIPSQEVSFDERGLCKCGGYVIVQNLPEGKTGIVWFNSSPQGELKVIPSQS